MRLSRAESKEIEAMAKLGELTANEIARRYHVSVGTVRAIKHGRRVYQLEDEAEAIPFVELCDRDSQPAPEPDYLPTPEEIDRHCRVFRKRTPRRRFGLVHWRPPVFSENL